VNHVRTLGLIGGMSPQSTALYYEALNAEVARRLGGHHSARLLLHSVDFGEIEALQQADDWAAMDAAMAAAAAGLQRGGAEAIVLCTNTMHRCSPAITAAAPLPFLHILDVLADALTAAGVTTAGVLGTRYTMEGSLYPEHLARRGIDVLVPDPAARATVNTVIYDELCHGVVRDTSREAYREVMAGLVARGAQGIVLGCTEIVMLVGPADATVPVFDTTALHVAAAIDWALGSSS